MLQTSQSSLASPAAASDVRQAASPFSSNADALARREAHSAAAAPAAEAGARVDAPAVSLGSLQYTLSMDEMALIHENARQYMQEHAASPSRTEAHAHAAAPPSQPEWLAPAADSVQAGSGEVLKALRMLEHELHKLVGQYRQARAPPHLISVHKSLNLSVSCTA